MKQEFKEEAAVLVERMARAMLARSYREVVALELQLHSLVSTVVNTLSKEPTP